MGTGVKFALIFKSYEKKANFPLEYERTPTSHYCKHKIVINMIYFIGLLVGLCYGRPRH